MSLMDLTATALSRGIAQRDFAPSEVMADYLARLEAINPRINAVVSSRDPQALMDEARACLLYTSPSPRDS